MTDGHAVSTITDHAFRPRGEWFTTCAICHIAEAAHTRSSITHPPVDPRNHRCPDCVTARDFGKAMPHLPGEC